MPRKTPKRAERETLSEKLFFRTTPTNRHRLAKVSATYDRSEADILRLGMEIFLPEFEAGRRLAPVRK